MRTTSKDDRIQNANRLIYLFVIKNKKKKTFHLYRIRERFRSQFMAMNAYERHKRLINDYVRYYSKEKSFDAIFKRDT